MTARQFEPLHRQRYRLRPGVTRAHFIVWADWLEPEGVYEGYIDPSSHECKELWVRLLHPTDPDLTFLVEEADLEEVD